MHIEMNEPDLDADEGRYGFCPTCGMNVQSVRVDFGIGAIEYWGAHGTHHDWRDVCPICDADVTAPQRDDECESED